MDSVALQAALFVPIALVLILSILYLGGAFK